jgi:hypothetical protein
MDYNKTYIQELNNTVLKQIYFGQIPKDTSKCLLVLIRSLELVAKLIELGEEGFIPKYELIVNKIENLIIKCKLCQVY